MPSLKYSQEPPGGTQRAPVDLSTANLNRSSYLRQAKSHSPPRSRRGGVPGLRRHRLRPALRGVVASPRLLVGVIGLPRGGVLGGSGRGLTGLVGPGCGRGRSTARGLLLRVLLRGGLAGVIGLPGRGRVTPARAARWLHHADLCARLPDQEALGSSRWSSRAPPPAPHASKRRAGLPCRVDRCAEARGDVRPRVGGGFG